jgi:hypothetical protein
MVIPVRIHPMCKPGPRAIAAALASCLLALGWKAMEPVVPTEPAPTVDGKVFEGEYEAWARGINKSFGDRIGMRSRIYLRSSAPAGSLFIGIRSVNGFPDNEKDGVVLYIDSVAGGFGSTADLSDYGSVPRALVSGMGTKTKQRAVITFPSGFRPDYAIYIRYHDAGVFRLGAEYHDLLGASQANATTGDVKYVQSNGTNLEVQVYLDTLGLTPRAPVRFIATLLNGEDAYRSDEFIGVHALAGGSLGQKSATLGADDFMTYVPQGARDDDAP